MRLRLFWKILLGFLATWILTTIVTIAAISGSRDYLTGLMAQVESAALRIAGGLGAEVSVSWDFLENGPAE